MSNVKTVPVRIRVTKNDIREAAEREDGYDETSCPIACAVRRIIKNGQSRSVVISDDGWMSISGKRFNLPTWARRFVTVFDSLADYDVSRMVPRRRTLHLPKDMLKRS